MFHPLITLTTDFGLTDHFVGAMKGVILSICPGAQLVDITHEVPPFETTEGGFAISQAYPYFPKKTIHIVVVDPGVGTSRRPILAEAAGQYFVAPDNGILSLVLEREAHKVRTITAAKYFLPQVSHTFHGRDIFAPVAAHLAGGVPATRFGRLVSDYFVLSTNKPLQTGKRAWTGLVLKIDRFGNLITNFRMTDFPGIATRRFELAIGLRRVSRLEPNYAAAGLDVLFAIAGSSGYLEVATNQGSAAKALGCGTGAPVELTLW